MYTGGILIAKLQYFYEETSYYSVLLFYILTTTFMHVHFGEVFMSYKSKILIYMHAYQYMFIPNTLYFVKIL